MFSFFRPRANRPLGAPAVMGAISVICVLGLYGQSPSSASPGRSPAVSPQRTVAMIFAAHSVLRAPRSGAPVIAHISVREPITGERTVLPVSAHFTNAHGTRWLKVMLPGRPNGSSGWIREHSTRLAVTPWHLVVDLSARIVTVYLDGRPQRAFRAVVGKPSTPTPTGAFFVQETVKMPLGDPGGPFALALSARSDVLREFDGGPGQIAIHGRDDLGGTLGDAQSHGCVRLATRSITWLAARIGPGVPVTIDAR